MAKQINKCTLCGAQTKYDPETKTRKCAYCGSEYQDEPEKKSLSDSIKSVINSMIDDVKKMGEENSQESFETKEEKTENNKERNKRNKWIALFLCFCFGYLGAHKFYEKKNFWGILYLFTAGLGGIGVFVDFIKILLKREEYYYVD